MDWLNWPIGFCLWPSWRSSQWGHYDEMRWDDVGVFDLFPLTPTHGVIALKLQSQKLLLKPSAGAKEQMEAENYIHTAKHTPQTHLAICILLQSEVCSCTSMCPSHIKKLGSLCLVLVRVAGAITAPLSPRNKNPSASWGVSVWSLHVLPGYSGFLPQSKIIGLVISCKPHNKERVCKSQMAPLKSWVEIKIYICIQRYAHNSEK